MWQVISDSDGDSDEAFAKKQDAEEWNHLSKTTRFRMSMEERSTPWTPEHALSGLNRKKPRCLDLADVGYWAYLLATPCASDRKKNPRWFADLSQGVQRKPWGPVLPCLNQDSIPYSYELDRVLSLEDCRGPRCKPTSFNGRAVPVCTSGNSPELMRARPWPTIGLARRSMILRDDMAHSFSCQSTRHKSPIVDASGGILSACAQ